MTNKEKDNLKAKINALLAKNVENGATEAEAAIALEKAQELMTKYMIAQSELDIKNTKCVKLEVPIYPSNYNLYFVHKPIAELFDCMVWMVGKNKEKRAIYFGFEEDTQLASYFYNYLCRMMVTEAAEYKKTDQYKRLAAKSHGRTVIADFIQGLQLRLIERIDEQIAQKRKTVKESTSKDLVVVKTNVVNEEFAALNMKLQSKSVKVRSQGTVAYAAGHKRGNEVEIRQGIRGESRKQKAVGAS